MGRQNSTTAPDGTITYNVLDALGNVAATYQGTNDTGATDSAPDAAGQYAGTLSPGATWDTSNEDPEDPDKCSVSLSGNQQYVSVAPNAAFEATGAFTVSMWVRVVDVGPTKTDTLLDTRSAAGLQDGYSLWLTNGTIHGRSTGSARR